MKNHMKRESIPNNWPIPRKGTTFVVKKNSNGIPVLVVLREMMGIAQNRKEVKMAIHKKDLMISNKLVNDEKKSLELFDVLTIIPVKKSYRLQLNNNGKYEVVEIKDKDATTKVSKIIGKKLLNGKKTQVSLMDGRNFLSEVKCRVNDSALIDLKKNEIKKVLELKEKANVLVFAGKHAGHKGKIKKIISEHKMAEIESKEGIFNALIKQIIVLE